MPIATFSRTALATVVAYARKHDAQVALVGDAGIYFCAMCPAPEGSTTRVLAHARETDRTRMSPADSYAAKRAIYGGDDGCDRFDADDIGDWLDTTTGDLAVRISASAIAFLPAVPRAARSARSMQRRLF